ncbi:MAG: uncharacterized protein KVP18_001483, partial [Porospora cf. gigantea A]|uniref:uncharacterized protein n=1 Tax=Porospora cf. gigantea A TaxID=2853593 RepID=UPI003559C9CC
MHEGYLEHAPHEGTLRSPAGLIRLTLAPSRGSTPAGPTEDAWATVPEVRQIPPFPGSRQSLQSELSKGLLVASSFPPRGGDGTSGRAGPSRDPPPQLGSGTEREDGRTQENVRPAADARAGGKRLLRHDGGGPRYPASLIDWPDLEHSIPKHGLLSREGWPPPASTAGAPTRPRTREAPAARDPLGPGKSEPRAERESRKRNRPGPKSEARSNPHAKFFAPAWEYGPRTDYSGCGFLLPLSGFLEEGPVPAKTDPSSPLTTSPSRTSTPFPGLPTSSARSGNPVSFVALDLRAGYWQVKMEPDSIPYTAFRCTGGLYQFTVMPFGLRNVVDCLLGDL